jgi:hypothetical protein
MSAEMGVKLQALSHPEIHEWNTRPSCHSIFRKSAIGPIKCTHQDMTDGLKDTREAHWTIEFPVDEQIKAAFSYCKATHMAYVQVAETCIYLIIKIVQI